MSLEGGREGGGAREGGRGGEGRGGRNDCYTYYNDATIFK